MNMWSFNLWQSGIVSTQCISDEKMWYLLGDERSELNSEVYDKESEGFSLFCGVGLGL